MTVSVQTLLFKTILLLTFEPRMTITWKLSQCSWLSTNIWHTFTIEKKNKNVNSMLLCQKWWVLLLKIWFSKSKQVQFSLQVYILAQKYSNLLTQLNRKFGHDSLLDRYVKKYFFDRHFWFSPVVQSFWSKLQE